MSARGNERRAKFHDDKDRRHFLELLAELPERFVADVKAAWKRRSPEEVRSGEFAGGVPGSVSSTR